MAKNFNRDVRISGGGALYVNEIKVIDESGNIDAPVTTTNLTVSGTLAATGASTMASTLGVTGATTLGSTLTVAGAVTCTTGCQSTAFAAIATTAGATTGTIPAGTSFVSVTSDHADKVVKLPTPVLGNIIYIQEASAVGFEVRPAAVTQYINGTLCESDKELAMAAGVGTAMFICTVGGAAGKWTQFFIDEDGTIDSGGTPD